MNLNDEWRKLDPHEGECDICKNQEEVAQFLYLKICEWCFCEYHIEGHKEFMRTRGYGTGLSYDDFEEMGMYDQAAPDVDWTYDDEYSPDDYDLSDGDT